MSEIRLVVGSTGVTGASEDGTPVDLDAELALAALAGREPPWRGLLRVTEASLRLGAPPAELQEVVDRATPLDWQGRWPNVCGVDGVRAEWHWLWRATAEAVEQWDMIRALSACASTRVLVELYRIRTFWLDPTYEAPDFAAAVAARPDAPEDALLDVATHYPATWTILSENPAITPAVRRIIDAATT